MDFGGIGSSLISGGASLIGGLINNSQNAQLAYQNNMANYMMQLQNQAWQQSQRATAYQVAVKDMKKAGLNPAMMYGGSGGPAPIANPGSTSFQAAHMENAVGPAVDRIVNALRLSNETELNNAVINKTNTDAAASAAQARNLNAEAANKEAITPWVAKQAAATLKHTGSSARAQEAQGDITFAGVPGAHADSKMKIMKTEDYRQAGDGPMSGAAISIRRGAEFALELKKAAAAETARLNSAKAHNEAMGWKHRHESGTNPSFKGNFIRPTEADYSLPLN